MGRAIGRTCEEAGLSPEAVAERLDLELGAVYAALVYYHQNPAEKHRVQERHERASEEAARRTSVRPPPE